MKAIINSNGTMLRRLLTGSSTASSNLSSPILLTVADLEHSAIEERWFSVVLARDGKLLSVANTWSESEPLLRKIRIITARRATAAETSHYQENR